MGQLARGGIVAGQLALGLAAAGTAAIAVLWWLVAGHAMIQAIG